MPELSEFQFKRATSVAQAVEWLAADPGARLHAGGTDLLPNLRRGIGPAPVLIDLGAVHGLSDIALTETGVALGARVTLAQLGKDPTIARQWPVLAEAANAVAGPAHRSVATLGGNLCLDTRCVYYNQSVWWRAANQHCLKSHGEICHVAPQGHHCHAAFSGDMAPALLVVGAEVDLLSTRGARRIALEDLYRDDGAAHLRIEHDEVLTNVHVPALRPGQRCGYQKARTRGAMDFPLAGVAVALTLHDGSSGVRGAIAELRVGITGTNSQPLRLSGCEAFTGRRVDAELLVQLGKLVQKQVSPMRSTATPANYRRLAAAALTLRLVRELAAGEGTP
jgi:4-hydroxybenzoyl-CoA reductase subunit beta